MDEYQIIKSIIEAEGGRFCLLGQDGHGGKQMKQAKFPPP
jgi:hypothetical protein